MLRRAFSSSIASRRPRGLCVHHHAIRRPVRASRSPAYRYVPLSLGLMSVTIPDRTKVTVSLSALYVMAHALSLCSDVLRRPAVFNFVQYHLRCSYRGITKHKRWHTLLTSSFIVRWFGDTAMIITLLLGDYECTLEPFFDMEPKGDPLATRVLPEGGTTRQLPLYGFISLFASSAIVSNVLELRAGRKLFRLNAKRGWEMATQASVASPLAAVLTWTMIARDEFGLALMGPAVAVVGAARGSAPMIGSLGAYIMVALHWQLQHAWQARGALVQNDDAPASVPPAPSHGRFHRLWRYVFFQRNPLVQLIYVGLMPSCMYFAVREAYPLVPNAYVAEHHKWIAAALFVVCSGLYVHLCRSDPGVITPATIDSFTRYPHHPVLFPEAKYCRTCKLPKLPRSKHCSMCNHCVARFDHHACVGEKNYKHFVLFLVIQLALCVDVLYIAASVFVVQAEEQVVRTGAHAPQSSQHEAFRLALHHVVANNQPLGFTAAMSFMVGAVVWVFLLVQLKRITLNVTANESFKRDELRLRADPDSVSGAKRLFRYLVSTLPGRRRPSAASVSRAERKKLLDASWGGLFSPDLVLNTEQAFTRDDVDFNPYSLGGFWPNLQDAFQWRRRETKRKAQ
ncbi:hypothetical protein P43SY_010569 [Pythium insidiosum]|uniref:Palmitoyltransferase n=1 Tax=Pythium insidiosum TaxID=114742 RepID=A0AAD5L920_PYTIN|nr:hypothetical protein P43SY_010569 [Pythium insidiosum]